MARKQIMARRSRADYPAGVIAVYDNGGPDNARRGGTVDRYTVVYAPVTYGGIESEARPITVYPYVGMSCLPFHPQGFCQHGEARVRPVSSWGGRGRGRVIAFSDLPPDCQAVVRRDLEQETGEGS